jgi:hypothetical protein
LSGSFGIHRGALEILAAISANFVEVGKPPVAQLLGKEPDHLGLFLLDVP